MLPFFALFRYYYISSKHCSCINLLQIRSLYEYAGTRDNRHLILAQHALDGAKECIQRRELDYRVPFSWVASWSDNPTVYRYRYLWTVKSMYYWYVHQASLKYSKNGFNRWRDEAIAILSTPTRGRTPQFVSPCFRNIQIAVEELSQFHGIYSVDRLLQLIRDSFKDIPFVHDLTDCFSAPKEEPMYDRFPIPKLLVEHKSSKVGTELIGFSARELDQLRHAT